MEDVGIFYSYLVYFTTIWSILWPFGIHMLLLFDTFFPFWYAVPRKIWQPWSEGLKDKRRHMLSKSRGTLFQILFSSVFSLTVVTIHPKTSRS
jgi:hypothetical protein